MALAVAAGHNQFNGTYNPEIWSTRLLVKFYKATVFGDIANTDWEGEIKSMGDTVKIRNTPDVTISDYVKGQNLTTEHLQTVPIDLLIDKAKYFSFISEDIDDKQSNIQYWEDWSQDAAARMAINVDTGILADIFSSAHASNQGLTAGLTSSSYNLGATGTPLQLTKSNILDVIADMGAVLDEQDVPEDGRYIVLSPWAVNLIKQSDLQHANEYNRGGESVLRNGIIGMIDRFTIYRSNSLAPTVDGANTVTNFIFGQKTALTFASQLTKNETLRAESQFGDIHRGLNVYGYKVVKGEALGWLYAYK